MNDYIKIYENSISPELCELIINIFENSRNKHDGVTQLGIDKNVKNTTDLYFYSIENDKDNIENILSTEIYKKLENYLKNTFNVFKNKILVDHGFQIQKYQKNQGKYIMHEDSNIKWDLQMERVITFIWYLNDVDCGGETVFFDSIKIKPETGKLLLFPSCWCFPHQGLIPISNDKYIITGWFYTISNKDVINNCELKLMNNITNI